MFDDGQKSIECARGGRRKALGVLSGLCQGICEKQLDRVTFIEALAALVGIEIAAHFKRIQPLGLEHEAPRDQPEPAPRAPSHLRVPILLLPRRPLTVSAYGLSHRQIHR